MATINFNDYAQSGEIDKIYLAETLRFLSAGDGKFSGFILGLDDNGYAIAVKYNPSVIEWRDTDTTNFVVPKITPATITTNIITESITQDEGAHYFNGIVDNVDNTNDTALFMALTASGVEVDSRAMTIPAGTRSMHVNFISDFDKDYAAGTDFKVEVYGNSNTIRFRGDVSATEYKTVKYPKPLTIADVQKAAEEDLDYHINLFSSMPTNLAGKKLFSNKGKVDFDYDNLYIILQSNGDITNPDDTLHTSITYNTIYETGTTTLYPVFTYIGGGSILFNHRIVKIGQAIPEWNTATIELPYSDTVTTYKLSTTLQANANDILQFRLTGIEETHLLSLDLYGKVVRLGSQQVP